MKNEGNDNRKLDEKNQCQEDLKNADGVLEFPVPPSPPVDGLKQYYGEKKGNKTQCTICKLFYVNLDRHLTDGKNNCSRFLQDSGRDPGEGESEAEAEAGQVYDRLVGCLAADALCASFFRLFEAWLGEEYVKPCQDIHDRMVENLQLILDLNIGPAARSPWIILLIGLVEFLIANREGIGKKFKRKKPPEDSNPPDLQPEFGHKLGSGNDLFSPA